MLFYWSEEPFFKNNLIQIFILNNRFDCSYFWLSHTSPLIRNTLFLYKLHLHKQRQAEIGKKLDWTFAIWRFFTFFIHIIEYACLYSCDYTSNQDENEEENKK